MTKPGSDPLRVGSGPNQKKNRKYMTQKIQDTETGLASRGIRGFDGRGSFREVGRQKIR